MKKRLAFFNLMLYIVLETKKDIQMKLPYWEKLVREKELKENRIITINDMAKSLGISRQHLQLIINSISGYNKRLIDLALFLDTTPEELRESFIREAKR